MADRRVIMSMLLLGIIIYVFLFSNMLAPPTITRSAKSTMDAKLQFPPQKIHGDAEINPGELFERSSWILSEVPVRSDSEFQKFRNLECTDDSEHLIYRNYSDTLLFQNRLFQYQNPNDCSSRKFVVQSAQWGSGFGTDMQARATVMLRALTHGRIYLETADQDWAFRARECVVKNSPECYFLPVSNCSVPLDWRKLTKAPAPWKYLEEDILPQYILGRHELSPLPVDLSPFPEFKGRSSEWWYSQVLRYQMRPNFFTRSEVIYPALKRVFPPAGYLPEEFGSVFVRRGDKGLEATLRPIDDYMVAVAEKAKVLHVRTLYLASDSPEAIDYVMLKYGSSYRIHYLPYERLRGGWNDTMEFREKHPEILSRLGVATISDLFISANAMFYVGTLTSRQCQLINALRRTYGNTCLKYTSLD